MSDPLSRYLDYYRALAPGSIDELHNLVIPTIHFRDPFNDVHSSQLMAGIFKEMFESTIDPRFIIESVVGTVPHVFLRWHLTFRPRQSRYLRARALSSDGSWTIDGASEVRWNEAGLVVQHLDFWDAAQSIYEKLPVLGSILERMRSRLAVK